MKYLCNKKTRLKYILGHKLAYVFILKVRDVESLTEEQGHEQDIKEQVIKQRMLINFYMTRTAIKLQVRHPINIDELLGNTLLSWKSMNRDYLKDHANKRLVKGTSTAAVDIKHSVLCVRC